MSKFNSVGGDDKGFWRDPDATRAHLEKTVPGAVSTVEKSATGVVDGLQDVVNSFVQIPQYILGVTNSPNEMDSWTKIGSKFKVTADGRDNPLGRAMQVAGSMAMGFLNTATAHLPHTIADKLGVATQTPFLTPFPADLYAGVREYTAFGTIFISGAVKALAPELTMSAVADATAAAAKQAVAGASNVYSVYADCMNAALQVEKRERPVGAMDAFDVAAQNPEFGGVRLSDAEIDWIEKDVGERDGQLQLDRKAGNAIDAATNRDKSRAFYRDLRLRRLNAGGLSLDEAADLIEKTFGGRSKDLSRMLSAWSEGDPKVVYRATLSSPKRMVVETSAGLRLIFEAELVSADGTETMHVSLANVQSAMPELKPAMPPRDLRLFPGQGKVVFSVTGRVPEPSVEKVPDYVRQREMVHSTAGRKPAQDDAFSQQVPGPTQRFDGMRPHERNALRNGARGGISAERMNSAQGRHPTNPSDTVRPLREHRRQIDVYGYEIWSPEQEPFPPVTRRK